VGGKQAVSSAKGTKLESLAIAAIDIFDENSRLIRINGLSPNIYLSVYDAPSRVRQAGGKACRSSR